MHNYLICFNSDSLWTYYLIVLNVLHVNLVGQSLISYAFFLPSSVQIIILVPAGELRVILLIIDRVHGIVYS